LAVEKPDVGDAERGASLAGFLFANLGEGGTAFAAVFVGAASAARAINHGHALVFVVNGANEVGSDGGFVIGMSDYNEDVGFEALVGRFHCSSFLSNRARGKSREQHRESQSLQAWHFVSLSFVFRCSEE